jgi:FKBP-type peptidyl-prolyl cis-trans isomerase
MTTTNNNNDNDDKVGAGILIYTLKKGTGTTHPQNGNFCDITCKGSLEDGTLLCISPKMLTFQIGTHQVMEGLEVAVKHMVEGQEAQVTIPHPYAYGEQGFLPLIPPRSTLVFDIVLVKISRE